MDAAEFARRQIAIEATTLRRDAERLADDARLYANTAATTAAARPDPGSARRLADLAVQVAQQAARLAAIQETAAYMSTKES